MAKVLINSEIQTFLPIFLMNYMILSSLWFLYDPYMVPIFLPFIDGTYIGVIAEAQRRHSGGITKAKQHETTLFALRNVTLFYA